MESLSEDLAILYSNSVRNSIWQVRRHEIQFGSLTDEHGYTFDYQAHGSKMAELREASDWQNKSAFNKSLKQDRGATVQAP
jgi:hypothetical protein